MGWEAGEGIKEPEREGEKNEETNRGKEEIGRERRQRSQRQGAVHFKPLQKDQRRARLTPSIYPPSPRGHTPIC